MKSTKLKRFYVLFTLYASVISLVCIMCASKTDFSITAGGSSANTFYVNAPAYVAGGGTMSTSDGTITFNGNGGVKSLFTTSGISGEVLADLLNMVNNTSVWGTKTVSSSGATYLSAKDFGKYNQSSTTETDQNSQIVVKLFEDTSTTTNNVNLASNQYWQAVYRSMSASSDVLTLYMCKTYTTSQFASSYANYSISLLRSNTVLPLYETLKSTYSSLDAYVVAPNAIPGLWQSSAYQTSNRGSESSSNSLGLTNSSSHLGASGYCDAADSSWGYEFGINNGMDGVSGIAAWSSWDTIESTYSDKLWIPSGFEVLHTGYTPTTSQLPSDRQYDGDSYIVFLSNYSTTGATVSNASGDNRTGLWELNGFDRASNDWAWLRSGGSDTYPNARGVN